MNRIKNYLVKAGLIFTSVALLSGCFSYKQRADGFYDINGDGKEEAFVLRNSPHYKGESFDTKLVVFPGESILSKERKRFVSTRQIGTSTNCEVVPSLYNFGASVLIGNFDNKKGLDVKIERDFMETEFCNNVF